MIGYFGFTKNGMSLGEGRRERNVPNHILDKVLALDVSETALISALRVRKHTRDAVAVERVFGSDLAAAFDRLSPLGRIALIPVDSIPYKVRLFDSVISVAHNTDANRSDSVDVVWDNGEQAFRLFYADECLVIVTTP